MKELSFLFIESASDSRNIFGIQTVADRISDPNFLNKFFGLFNRVYGSRDYFYLLRFEILE